MIQKQFTIPCTTKSIQTKDTEGNNTLYLTGIANTGMEDLVGDVVTQQALESIAEQIPMHNLHMDHDHDWTGIVGRMTEGWVEDDGVHFKARILRERADEIQSYLEQDVIMGASISGCCEYEENSLSDIAKWQLTEISLTPIPCDQATLGSVVVAKSFVDAVRGLKKKNDEGDKMAEGNNEAVTTEQVEEMINTAINEIRDTLIEDVTQKVDEKYDAKINELVARVETLEGQEEENTDDEGEATGEGGESPAINGEGEAKATNEEEEEDTEEGEAEEEEEDDEEAGKSVDLATEIRKAVREEIQKVFKAPSNPDFHYEEDKKNIKNPDTGDVAGKAYTPRELAKLLTQTQ